jgi:cobalt-zinc-cadmium efflux system outer membrane protein
MCKRCLPLVFVTLLMGGCLYHVHEDTDRLRTVLAAQPLDLAPASHAPPEPLPPPTEKKAAKNLPQIDTDRDFEKSTLAAPNSGKSLKQASYSEADDPRDAINRFSIPGIIPGSEATIPLVLPKDPEERRKLIEKVFGDLPKLSEMPSPLPGPEGKPYSLADFQQLAAQNSWQLAQAAADVKAAEGNLRTARAYPNPTVGYEVDPSNDGSTSGVQGLFFDQTVKLFGKLKHQSAAAEKDLENAQLALARARSDLATAVRTAYFNHLVAKETVRVTLALAEFTDEVYRIQRDLAAKSPIAAAYEPYPLRAQANQVRLALNTAIVNYNYTWTQLVATIGLRQLPLSEVSGRIDRAIPVYDYNRVLAHILRNHTDVLIARNGIEKARYNLKFAQVTPYPDVDFRVAFLKEFALAPQQFTTTLQVGITLPIWDQNQGNIMAAEAALYRADRDPQRVEMTLTYNLGQAFVNYKSALDSMEFYRRYILPDQVRAYLGVYQRYRGVEIGVLAFNDVVTAQQTLISGVNTYLATLGQLWTSVVGVADFLQTDDLFQLGEGRGLPELPELKQLPSCLYPPGRPGMDDNNCLPSAVPGRSEAAPPRPLGALSATDVMPRQLPPTAVPTSRPTLSPPVP